MKITKKIEQIRRELSNTEKAKEKFYFQGGEGRKEGANEKLRNREELYKVQ